MVVISTIIELIDICLALIIMAQETASVSNTNIRRCRDLGEKVTSVKNILQRWERKYSSQKLPAAAEESLENLQLALRDVQTFIEKFSSRNSWKRYYNSNKDENMLEELIWKIRDRVLFLNLDLQLNPGDFKHEEAEPERQTAPEPRGDLTFDELTTASYTENCWEAAAIEDAASQCARAWSYMFGLGVPQDLECARHWTDRSASQGYGPATLLKSWLSDVQGHQGQFCPLIDWLSVRANNGDVTCKTWLAWGHMKDKVHPHLPSEDPLMLLTLAASRPASTPEDGAGAAWAKFILGECHQYGLCDTEQNERGAFHHYLEAAHENLAHAQCHVAACYEHGSLGAKRSRDDAKWWYTRAASQNFAGGQYNLGRLMQEEHEQAQQQAGEVLMSLTSMQFSSFNAFQALVWLEEADRQGLRIAGKALESDRQLAEGEMAAREALISSGDAGSASRPRWE